MSNEQGNEQGNDTAAQAFQVGDRVRHVWYDDVAETTRSVEGVVERIDEDGALYIWTGYAHQTAPADFATLTARATPAPAVRASGAVDTHTLELPVMVSCGTCNGHQTLHNDAWPDETDYPEWVDCPECGGLGYHERTIRLTDAALDRLAAALAPVLVKHMVRDIRMIANDRP